MLPELSDLLSAALLIEHSILAKVSGSGRKHNGMEWKNIQNNSQITIEPKQHQQQQRTERNKTGEGSCKDVNDNGPGAMIQETTMEQQGFQQYTMNKIQRRVVYYTYTIWQ